jgi:phenylalanyl-tRNA synthetase alpha chain
MKTRGHLHPLTLFGRLMVTTLTDMGFAVADYPEIETEWYNFDGLNVPKDHPARDVQDTFFTTDGRVLRTHCSTVQLKFAEHHRPPFRAVQIGRSFRNEATDATHEAVFHQLDAVAVDKNITMGNLLATQERFIAAIFGDTQEYRFVPSFFPFVEPGMEVHLKFKGKWLEMWGAGMIHPQVLQNMKINPALYSGFAFGMGVERLAMLYYGIDDIRTFLSGDLRLISQF